MHVPVRKNTVNYLEVRVYRPLLKSEEMILELLFWHVWVELFKDTDINRVNGESE